MAHRSVLFCHRWLKNEGMGGEGTHYDWLLRMGPYDYPRRSSEKARAERVTRSAVSRRVADVTQGWLDPHLPTDDGFCGEIIFRGRGRQASIEKET